MTYSHLLKSIEFYIQIFLVLIPFLIIFNASFDTILIEAFGNSLFESFFWMITYLVSSMAYLVILSKLGVLKTMDLDV